jgi:hypothetical protein
MSETPIPPPEKSGVATVRRYLDPTHVVSLAEADFEPIFRVYAEHVNRWELPLDGLSLTMMREGLAAMALHLVGRPPDESVGVTINVQTPPLNIFLTGDPGERTLTGRVFTEDVRTGSSSRMFVQAFRPATGPMQSTIDVDGLDVLGMFEQYYDRSEQSPARFFELGGDRYGMVRALPDGGADRVRALTADSAAALFAGETDLLETQAIRFRCGCNPDKIMAALRGIFSGKEEELFLGEPAVEAFCPRCGARWWIERTAYDGGSAT